MNQTAAATTIESDAGYHDFESLIAQRVANLKGPLFTTEVQGQFPGLTQAYLTSIPKDHRQHYTCNCCGRFIERYGGLVTIENDGTLRSVMWNIPIDDVPLYFVSSVAELNSRVFSSRVSGVFLSDEPIWGVPHNVAGPGSKYVGQKWTHLHGQNPMVYKNALKTADQTMAEKLQDYIMLKRGIAEVPMAAVVQAVRVLESDAVDRGEKTLGLAKWLLELHGRIADVQGRHRDNLIWLAVATAPPGWCHIRSTMIATLLDDVVAGIEFDEIKRRWDAKMHPLKYQRPTALSEGNVKQANETVAKLGSAGALARRYARLSEVTALWKPRELPPTAQRQDNPFDHLLLQTSKTVKPVELPAKKVVWGQFLTHLLAADKCEVYLGHNRLPMFGMVTAVDPQAPPILQWDGLADMSCNPVSWYFWHGGSTPRGWGLTPGWAKVNAVCLKPCHWQSDKFEHHGGGAFFILDGAMDTLEAKGGFFPEMLRSEYHSIRHAMEAFAGESPIQGRDEGDANGIAMQKDTVLAIRLTTGGELQTYEVAW